MKGKPFAKVVGVLRTVAPTFLSGVTGPLAPLVSGIAKQVLGNGPMTDEQLEEAVYSASGTTAGLAKLREIEAAAIKAQQELAVKFEELQNADRADARSRQMELKDTAPQTVLYITSVGFFGVLAWLLAYGLPPNGGEVLLIMTGSLGSAWGAAVQYFVGSSSGSKQKTDLLSK